MSITINSGKLKDNAKGGYEIYLSIINDLDKSYNWIKTDRSTYSYTDLCYFTDKSYLQVEGQSIGRTNAKFIMSVVNNGKKNTLYSIALNDKYITYCFTKTSNGFAFQLSSSTDDYIDVQHYNLYIGEITQSNNTKIMGCIYEDDNGNITIITDDCVSQENAIGSNINADRKSILVPVVNTTNGEIFNNIFIMRYSPIQYNTMEVEGNGVFVCGKTVALKD